MKRRPRPLLTWIYDTREQRPYDLAVPDPQHFDDGGWIEEKLEAGDISCEVDGERISAVVERKALLDFLACCGRERERFENELARLAAYAHASVIIEAPLSMISAGDPHSQITGNAARASLACWSVKYGVHVWCATNRIEGQVMARLLLQEAAKHR